jgi:hypothetical protein
MSFPAISVYDLPGQTEGRIDIDRRRLLSAAACLALTGLAGSLEAGTPADADEVPVAPPWHPLTRSLLYRARRASSADGRANTSRVERVIQGMADAQDCARSPVIKWLPDPSCAFQHLSGYSLDALLQMDTGSLWRRATPSSPLDDESLDQSLVLGALVADIVGVEDHDRALMAPKLLAKSKAMAGNASIEASFEVRAVAAQIGWLETSIPMAAAEAVANVELLLSTGSSGHEELIHHQLRVFEAYELGLLATWETPSAVICVPRMIAV